MELHTSTESIRINEVLFNDTMEQSVELDYMLPDYCPNIFKVLKCSICPSIAAQSINGTKLSIDGTAFIRILYISEDTGKLRQIEQKQAFTKTVELKEDCSGGMAKISAKCDYVNCRAVNQRRLDIRGAISMRGTITKSKQMNLISDCEEMQLHKQQAELCENRMYTCKDFTVKEELQIGHGSHPIQDILNYEATAVWTEYKLLANKVVCKGEVLLHTLYLCSDNPDKPEVVEHSIPISQIIDFEGIDEDFTCSSTLEVVKYDIDMQIEDDGECRSFVAQLNLRAHCEAGRNKTIQLIDDCYSTCFQTQASVERMKLEKLQQMVSESVMIKNSLKLAQNDLTGIHDILYTVNTVSWRLESEQMLLTCNLQLSILALNGENIPICIEQNMPCECALPVRLESEDCSFDPTVTVTSLAYNIVSMEEIEIRAELKINGLLFELRYTNAITQITVDENQPKQRGDDCALRLYYADEGENIWEIAKRYNTSVRAILEENSIEREIMESRGMILIPIVD